ncbi:MAG: CRISPR-associated endonuclease Cas2 [Thiomonas sp. 13-66-29]|jgi:CRISPR-associated protein Cas2|nr:MAG: CRISPR-associated endonuclease Cas2 [Thiomonas sp. 13-66-29]
MSRLVVLAYDIADDKRRRAVARTCEQRMLRVQESVFEAWLTPHETQAIVQAVGRCIDPTVDQVRVYPLALRQLARRRVLGPMPAAQDTPDYLVV